MNNMDSPTALLKTVSPNTNCRCAFKLVGGPKSPRDAIGTTLYLNANDPRQRAGDDSGGRLASTSDMRPHFGLGTATKVDSLEVHWPSGAVEQFEAPQIDRMITLREGAGKAATAVNPERK